MIVQSKIVFIAILFFLISFVGIAQGIPQGGGDGPPAPSGGPPPPGELPIDNGLIVLFVVAIIYGVYRTLKFSKKPTQV